MATPPVSKRPFAWRDRRGVFYLPSEMVTRHLFLTLRMIWNHVMPDSARFHPYACYKFTPFYTEQYFKRAIVALANELSTRTDLAPSSAAELYRMQHWLIVTQLKGTS